MSLMNNKKTLASFGPSNNQRRGPKPVIGLTPQTLAMDAATKTAIKTKMKKFTGFQTGDKFQQDILEKAKQTIICTGFGFTITRAQSIDQIKNALKAIGLVSLAPIVVITKLQYIKAYMGGMVPKSGNLIGYQGFAFPYSPITYAYKSSDPTKSAGVSAYNPISNNMGRKQIARLLIAFIYPEGPWRIPKQATQGQLRAQMNQLIQNSGISYELVLSQIKYNTIMLDKNGKVIYKPFYDNYLSGMAGSPLIQQLKKADRSKKSDGTNSNDSAKTKTVFKEIKSLARTMIKQGFNMQKIDKLDVKYLSSDTLNIAQQLIGVGENDEEMEENEGQGEGGEGGQNE